MLIIRPKTLVRWHRAGLRRYWRWKSRSAGGRPQIHAELRALIWRMSVDNRLWGAPHIHGELLKLGFPVTQSTVAKYMAKRGDPSGQRWSTFLRNHMPHIAAMDLFVVPTIGFIQLYVLVIVRLARRELVRINVTAHPTAEWITQQLTEAFPWNEAPRYLIRDRDGIYGCCGHAPITSRVSGATRRRYEACTPIGTHHALASRYEAPACGVGPRSPSYSPSPPRRRRGRGEERSAASDSGLAMEAT